MEEFIVTHLFEFLMTIAIGFLGALYRAAYKEIGNQKVEREAIKNLLRSEIITMHGRYMDRGEIPIYAQENVQAMYEAYHKLGGNGTVTKLVQEIMNLPTQKNRKET